MDVCFVSKFVYFSYDKEASLEGKIVYNSAPQTTSELLLDRSP